MRLPEQDYSGHAEGEPDLKRMRELQKSSREPTIAAAMVFGSLISEKASNNVLLSNDLGYSIWPRSDDLIGSSHIFRGP